MGAWPGGSVRVMETYQNVQEAPEAEYDRVTRSTTQPRSIAQRRAAALDMLQSRDRLWLCTGGGSGAHLIPVGFVWDGEHIMIATREQSVTAANIRSSGTARVAIGEPDDVAIIDSTASVLGVDDLEPAIMDAFVRLNHLFKALPERVVLRLVPTRILVWKGFREHADRIIMRDGNWLG